MCRITGFIDFDYRGNYSVEDVIVSMRDTMAYGGPDDSGIYIEKEKGLALGHRRLSILDLSNLGHQPMRNDSGNIWLTYNGEIYNFKEIKTELEANGHQFKSTSDTEVLLKAYEQWGIEAVHRFRGMWAFAIWDKRKEALILCRDRAGVKPLFWYLKDGIFIFSSELKALHKHPRFVKKLDRNALSLYLKRGYIAAPDSIFEYVHKLEPGSYLEINKKGQIKKAPYWDIADYYAKGAADKKKWLARPEEEIAGQLEDILTDSFKLRLVADVPVGVFLSGGIDSSLVSALLQKESTNPIKTFTIGFHEDKFNEARWAKGVADYLGTDHTELYCAPQDVLKIIPQLPELYDEPIGDSSAIPTHLVSCLAKQKVKVSLSADGGDELFCGYNTYLYYGRILNIINHIPRGMRSSISGILNRINPDSLAGLYKKGGRFLPPQENVGMKFLKFRKLLKSDSLHEEYLNQVAYFTDEELAGLVIYPFHKTPSGKTYQPYLDQITNLMFSDFVSYLPDDLLVKVDRATMAVALEGREPFLDNKVTEYASQLPLEYKYKSGVTKYILKKILYRHIPKRFFNRPKHGFSVPIGKWGREKLRGLYQEYLNKERIEREGIFNAEAVHNLLSKHMRNEEAFSSKLWPIFSFQLWKEKWLN